MRVLPSQGNARKFWIKEKGGKRVGKNLFLLAKGGAQKPKETKI